MTRACSTIEAWPRLLRPEQAAAYVGEKSVESFRRAIPKLYPEPVRIPGKGDRWLKESLDAAIDRLAGRAPSITNAAEVL
jgi:predicted DNA-binding transcriptional regulator AlpA